MFMASFVFLSDTLRFSSAAFLFQHPLCDIVPSTLTTLKYSSLPLRRVSKQPHLKATTLFMKRWERSTAFKAFYANEFLNSSTIAINLKNIISYFNTLPTFIFIRNDHSNDLFQHIKAWNTCHICSYRVGKNVVISGNAFNVFSYLTPSAQSSHFSHTNIS